MKQIHRILAALAGAAIIGANLTACNNGTANISSTASEGQTPKGGYVETEITPPSASGSPLGLWVNTDGSIDYWAVDSGSPTGQGLYRSTDNGATWQTVDLSWVYDIQAGLILMDGTGTGGYFAVTQGGPLFEVWKGSKDQKPVKIPISGLEDAGKGGKMLVPTKLQALGEDSFLLEYIVADAQPGMSDVAVAVAGNASEAGNTPSVGGSEPGSSSEEESQTVRSGVIFSYTENDGTGTDTQYQQKIGVYNLKGELVSAFTGQQSVRSVAKNKQTLFLMNYSGEVQAYEITTGNVLPQYANKAELSDINAAFTVDEAGNTYIASNTGIQRIAPGGSLAETVLEGDMYSFGTPTTIIRNLCNIKEGNFLMLCASSAGGGKLYRYVYDATVSVTPKNTLTVWSLKESPTVRAAIQGFQQKNKDIRVNYEVAITGEQTSAGEQDVQRTLITELLAGKGPDVLILDGLDYQSYIKQGLLSDLSKQVDVSGLYPSVIKHFQGSDGLYVLPTRFSFPLLLGNKSELDTLNSLNDFAATIKAAPQPKPIDMNQEDYQKAIPENERSAFTFQDLREAFDFFYKVSEPAIIDSSKGIQTDALRQLLDNVKAVSDHYQLANSENQAEKMNIGVSVNASGSVIMIDKGLMDFTLGHTLYGSSNFTTLDIMRYVILTSGGDEPDVKLMPGLSQGVYYPVAMAGVNAKSLKQKEAMSFIAAMLSDEIQAFTLGDGLPVTQSGMKQLVDTYNKENKEITLSALKMDIDSLVSQVTTPVTINSTVADIIYKSAESYCKGEIGIEDAINAIKTDTEIILAEKQ